MIGPQLPQIAAQTISLYALLAIDCFATAICQPAQAAGLPGCLPPALGSAAVDKVEENGVLRLKDGRMARLEGLLWPGSEATTGIRQHSIAALRQLLAGRAIVLRARAPKLDRYRRLRIQALLPGNIWLQQGVLRQGLARASVAPDRAECASRLYAAEQEARTAHAGLWASTFYRIREPEALRRADLGTFQIVEGKVLSVKVTSARAYLNFGQNWRTDFTVTIGPDDLKRFRTATVDPYGYTGKPVRVRGWIDRMNGYEIEALSPAAIEVLK